MKTQGRQQVSRLGVPGAAGLDLSSGTSSAFQFSLLTWRKRLEDPSRQRTVKALARNETTPEVCVY